MTHDHLLLDESFPHRFDCEYVEPLPGKIGTMRRKGGLQ